MKKIRELNKPTPGLDEYLNFLGDEPNWDAFRSHYSGASYNELRDALTQNQHGLCAYCEIAIKEWRRLDDIDNPDEMNKWIRDLLTPNENGQLASFFTTTRSFFGTFSTLSESILAQQPQTWI